MSNYVGNNFWPDAAVYGAGLGQTLGQALIQRPQDRYELALRQRQMELQQAQLQAMNNYRMQGLDMRGQQNQLVDAIKMLSAQNQGNYDQGRLGQGQQKLDQTQNELMDYGNGAVGPRFLQPNLTSTNSFQQQVSQDGVSPFGHQQSPQGMPQGSFQVPRQSLPQNPATQQN